MITDQAWERLGELLIAARVAKGHTRRSAFARDLGLTHDRTLFDIENAKRQNFDTSTLAFIEQAYGWRTGSIRAVLEGGEPTPIGAATAPGPVPEVGASPARDVIEAIRSDTRLLPEAREHLISQYGLLLRIQGTGGPEPTLKTREEVEARGIGLIEAVTDLESKRPPRKRPT